MAHDVRNNPHIQTDDHGKRHGAFVTAFHIIGEPRAAEMSKSTQWGGKRHQLHGIC